MSTKWCSCNDHDVERLLRLDLAAVNPGAPFIIIQRNGKPTYAPFRFIDGKAGYAPLGADIRDSGAWHDQTSGTEGFLEEVGNVPRPKCTQAAAILKDQNTVNAFKAAFAKSLLHPNTKYKQDNKWIGGYHEEALFVFNIKAKQPHPDRKYDSAYTAEYSSSGSTFNENPSRMGVYIDDKKARSISTAYDNKGIIADLAATFHTHPLPDGTKDPTQPGVVYVSSKPSGTKGGNGDISQVARFGVPGIIAYAGANGAVQFVSYDENGICP